MTEPWDDPQAQYQAGYDAAINTHRPADCWVAVPVRWRHVRPGDAIAAGNTELWAVADSSQLQYGGAWYVNAAHGDREHSATVDPDGKITVLEKVTMHEAVTYTVEELGGIVIERRSA